MKKILVVVFSVLIFAACTMPETKIYSLSVKNEITKPAIRTGASINITVKSARYLSQSYIAHRTSPYELQISRYYKWDSAPDEIVKEAFRESLANANMFNEVRTSNFVAADVYSLEINLKKFERFDGADGSYGDLAFEVLLISPEGRELYRGSVSKRMKMAEKNFTGLAKVLSAGLSEGIEEVEAGIVKNMPAGT